MPHREGTLKRALNVLPVACVMQASIPGRRVSKAGILFNPKTPLVPDNLFSFWNMVVG